MPVGTDVESALVRRLGGVEQWFFAMDQHRPNHFSLVANIAGNLDCERCADALSTLQRRHPLLNVNIRRDHEGFLAFFRQSQAIPIPLTIKPYHTTTWKYELQEEARAAIVTDQAPLVRALVLHGRDQSDVILTIHHCIADGLALLFLMRDLLHALQGGVSSLLDIPVAEEESYRLHRQPLMGGNTNQDAKEASNINSEPSVAPRRWSYRQVQSTSVPDVLSHRLSKHQTDQLLHTTRREGVTVHSALTAALVLAGLGTSPSWKQTSVRVFTPINLREALRAGENVVVALGAGAVTVNTSSLSTVWDLARSAQNDLSMFRTIDGELVVAKLLGDQASTNPAAVPEFTAAALGYDLMLTNPGNVQFDLPPGTLSITSMCGPFVLFGLENEQSVSALTFNGCLTLTHTSYAPLHGLLPKTVELLLTAMAS